MTKNTKTAKNAEVKNAAETIDQTIESIQARFSVPTAAREFVKRNAAAAQERADNLHAGANTVADGAEKAAIAFVGGYAKFVRGMLDMAHDNVEHSLATVEKVAGAKSVGEALQIQADFVRENTRANYDRVRSAAEVARETVTDGVETIRDQATKYWPYGKKAA